MSRELMKAMTQANAPTEYVGAYLEGERRLMLVAVDPAEPWEAFRKLRRTLRRQKAEDAQMGLFEATAPIEHTADVISIRSRRRAG